ncbi:MAG TPA: hypothetical protein VFA81_08390 [Burkholderiales bacterium]|nr:hypothetical protein [Burkholderiales bacterium]
MNKRLVHGATLVPLAIGAASYMGTHTAAPAHEGATTASSQQGPVSFGNDTLACTLPFSTIEKRQDIDESCGLQGAATVAAQILQNTTKNNFCVAGTPTDVVVSDFAVLQQAAQDRRVTFGSAGRVPGDRSGLERPIDLGNGRKAAEGDLVHLVAYVIDAHASDVAKGESVNCATPGAEYNDIHIVLGESPDDDPCDSVTAEISPHYRPTQWNPAALNQVHRPLRFTGPLFFDASHSPCSNGKRANPPRQSLFEVHPVYHIDVCLIKPEGLATDALLKACREADDSRWMSLEQWTGSEDADEPT